MCGDGNICMYVCMYVCMSVSVCEREKEKEKENLRLFFSVHGRSGILAINKSNNFELFDSTF